MQTSIAVCAPPKDEGMEIKMKRKIIHKAVTLLFVSVIVTGCSRADNEDGHKTTSTMILSENQSTTEDEEATDIPTEEATTSTTDSTSQSSSEENDDSTTETSKHTEKQTEKRTEKQTEKKTEKQTEKNTEKQTEQQSTSNNTVDEGTKLAQQIVDEIITSSMSDLEKALIINDWLVYNVEYDWDNYLAGTIPGSSYSVEGTIKTGMAVCQGYASTFYTMAEQAGLEVNYVTGSANGYGGWEGHAWNQVKIDGTWYNVDVTWNDDWEPGNQQKIPGCDELSYFLISDSTLKEDHIWSSEYLPTCNKTYNDPKIAKILAKGNKYREGGPYISNGTDLITAIENIKKSGKNIDNMMFFTAIDSNTNFERKEMIVGKILAESGLCLAFRRFDIAYTNTLCYTLEEVDNLHSVMNENDFKKIANKYKGGNLETVQIDWYGTDFEESGLQLAEILLPLLAECNWRVTFSYGGANPWLVNFTLTEDDTVYYVLDGSTGLKKILQQSPFNNSNYIKICYWDKTINESTQFRDIETDIIKLLADADCSAQYAGYSYYIRNFYYINLFNCSQESRYIADNDDLEKLANELNSESGKELYLYSATKLDSSAIAKLTSNNNYSVNYWQHIASFYQYTID